MAFYVDTSALVKAVIQEEHSDAFRKWHAGISAPLVTSDLARAELPRAVRRADSTQAVRARAVLDRMTILVVTTELFQAAARLEPTSLRTLDAVHLACALDLGDDLEGLVAYDDRLLEAAQAYGVATITPT